MWAVTIVMDGAREPRIEYEVGLVLALGTGDYADADAVVGALREQGRSLEVDAVIHVHFDEGSETLAAIGVAVELAP